MEYISKHLKKMKNLFETHKIALKGKLLLLLLLSFTFITSCEKDENGNSLLVGKWEHVSYAITVPGEGIFDVVYTHAEGCSKNYYEFDKNGILLDVTHEQNTCKPVVTKSNYTADGIFLGLKGIEGNTNNIEYSFSVDSKSLRLTVSADHLDRFPENSFVVFNFKRI